MLRIFVYSLLGYVIAAGCKKDLANTVAQDNYQGQEKVYQVSYSMKGFGITDKSSLTNKETAANDYLDYLFYGAYDSTGKLVRKIEQAKRAGTEFGTISNSLKSGNYTIVLAATKDSILYTSGVDQLNTLQLSGQFPQDIFYKKFSLNIADRDTSFDNIRLDRLTGLLEIVLTDTVTYTNISMLVTSIDNSPGFYNVAGDSLTGTIATYHEYHSLLFGSQDPSTFFDGFYWGTNQPLTLKIIALDWSRHFYMQRIIQNVHIYPNKKTVLTGNFMSGTETSTASRISYSVDKRTVTQHF
ncbi:hypothetical protein QTN47_03910 [Danxiaibacter flavus]|uniref:DUF4397 domain-containing protein n=1 Tax=Danxiaibacter flavus TaxID=3049108 RepID=A0ABV3Z9S9_9BACT|nr:hypothetical protein QNM32_03910 [Chitinophagaceae bacterium DXS]